LRLSAVVAIAVIGDAYDHRAIDAERQHGVPRDVDGAAANLYSRHCSEDCANNAVVTGRVDAVGIGPHGIALAVHVHGFEVEYEVVIGSDPNLELDA
jgi:hypothetical protein